MVRQHDPPQPGQQEKEAHEMTLLPYRSWCRHYITRRGREDDCRKTMEEERQVPEVQLHGRREGREDVGVLGCKRKGNKGCAQYGGSEEDDGRMDSRRLMAWLREIGLESVDIIVKSDNEPALTSLIASWSTMRAMMSGSRMIVENSPVGSSKSNGIVERAIQSVQGMIRTIRSDIVAPTQSLSSSCSTTRMSVREGGDGCKEATKKRKAEEKHPEDPERDDGKWMRTDGNKRKVGEEREESKLRKTVRYLKELDKMENQKGSGKHRRSWRWRMLR